MKNKTKYLLIIFLSVGLLALVFLPKLLEKHEVCKASSKVEVIKDSENKSTTIMIDKTILLKDSDTKKQMCNHVNVSIPIIISDEKIQFIDGSNESINQIGISEKTHKTERVFTHGILNQNEIKYHVRYTLLDEESNKRKLFFFDDTIVYDKNTETFKNKK